jgi:hypothetical protein
MDPPTSRGGTVKTRRDVIVHDLPSRPDAPPITPAFFPLWNDVPMSDRLAPPFRGSTAEPSEHPVPCNVHPLDEHSVPNPIMPDVEPYVECTTVYRTCHRNLLFPSLRKRTIRAPAKYNDYVPSGSIIDQLVLVDNDELQ